MEISFLPLHQLSLYFEESSLLSAFVEVFETNFSFFLTYLHKGDRLAEFLNLPLISNLDIFR